MTQPCPDCGEPVVPVEARDGDAFADLCDDGPWVIHKFVTFDRPTAVRPSSGLSGPRGRRHRCSRRARIVDDLATVARAFDGRKTGPRLHVPVARVEGEISPGDALTLYDCHGHEVRAEVERVEFVAAVKLDTLRTPGKRAA